MKTNLKMTVVRLAVVGAMMAGLSAKAADAPVLRGKFTLPVAARWGMATLPAGEYSFTLDHEYAGGVVTILRGTQTVARVQSFGVQNSRSGRASIVLKDGAVRQLNVPQIGASFDYARPSSGRRQAPQPQTLTKMIPVGAVGVGR